MCSFGSNREIDLKGDWGLGCILCPVDRLYE